VLESTTVIRQGLETVDLLDGGAIGIGGGRQRHAVDGALGLTDRGSGGRLVVAWRGPSRLRIGSAAAPSTLEFGSFTRINLRLFAQLQTLFPSANLAKGVRLDLGIENLTGERQSVRSALGPLSYTFEPRFRDPVGRTISLELRKIF
jgi:outer membrane receptor protein involved in Fe transport